MAVYIKQNVQCNRFSWRLM